MRIRYLAGALLLGAAFPAFAADAVVQEEVVVVDAPAAYNWSGLYVGAQGGYAWGKSYFQIDDAHYDADIDPEGFVGGAYVGYNFQLLNNLVLGMEADIVAGGVDANVTGNHNGDPDSDIEMNGDVQYSAAIRGRLGYAMDRWLPYVAGGLSVAKYEFGLDDGENFSQKETFTGWNIGAGLEFAATDNIVIRGEYRFSDFGDWDGYNEWQDDDSSVDLKSHDIRLGVAYKF